LCQRIARQVGSLSLSLSLSLSNSNYIGPIAQLVRATDSLRDEF
jgi:hypothetical protein